MNDNLFLILPLVSMIGAWVSTITGMGGGLIILASCTLVLPITAALPISGVLVMSGQVARSFQFHQHINRKIARPFIPGALIGAAIGSLIYISMPETFMAFMLGSVMLWFCWIPPSRSRPKWASRVPVPYFWIGIIHTFLSTVAGVGGLFQSLMINSGMKKEGIIATIAGTLLFMSAFKTAAYAIAGFDYLPYLLVIILSWLAGYLGTALGRRCLKRVSDKLFRHLIQIMVTLFSMRLYWEVAQSLMGG